MIWLLINAMKLVRARCVWTGIHCQQRSWHSSYRNLYQRVWIRQLEQQIKLLQQQPGPPQHWQQQQQQNWLGQTFNNSNGGIGFASLYESMTLEADRVIAARHLSMQHERNCQMDSTMNDQTASRTEMAFAQQTRQVSYNICVLIWYWFELL